MNLNSVLVTGCGGDIGISVGRLLKSENPTARIIGVDVKQQHAGVAFFDVVQQVPPVNDETYLSQLTSLVNQHHVQLVIPITDYELYFFAKNKIRAVGNAPVLMPNDEAVLTGLDKLKTYEVLKQAGISMPYTALVKDNQMPPLPCIIKPRTGHGSKNIALVETEAEATFFARYRGDDIWQAYLPNDHAEYTCGLFCSGTGEVRTFILKRKLLGGLTGEGILEKQEVIDILLHQVAKALNLRGSINVQLRLTQEGPRIFEINPRFSSTVYFRHLLNFKDVIWSIQDKWQEALAPYQPAAIGTRIYRVFNELILPPAVPEEV